MPGCNCAGQSCGCALQAGPGIIVEGTGTNGTPFVVSLASRALTVSQAAAGVLDLSGYVGSPIITVEMAASVTGVILPDAPGTELELLLVLSVAGRTIAWPAEIRWAGGTAPALPTTVGDALWVKLRQSAGFWVGTGFGIV